MPKLTLLPREKLKQRGIASLSDTDLVSVILGAGVEGNDVFDVARRVVRTMSRQSQTKKKVEWTDLVRIHGMGVVKAMQIECAVELGSRLSTGKDQNVPVIRCRRDVEKLCRNMSKRTQEHVVVIALNARNQILGRKTIAIGSMNKAVVEPRDIFSWALEMHAAAIILVHNHPSGSRDPSAADSAFTDRVGKAGELLGIPLIDHVIV